MRAYFSPLFSKKKKVCDCFSLFFFLVFAQKMYFFDLGVDQKTFLCDL